MENREDREDREDKEDKEEYYMGTRMAIGCGLARIACRHSHTTLMQSTHKFSP